MGKRGLIMSLVGCATIFFVVSGFCLSAQQARAETLDETSMFFRISAGFSVDQEAAQTWLPSPWKAVSVSEGPFKGANLFILFDDKFIRYDGEGKLYKDGAYCSSALIGLGKNQQTNEVFFFVTKIFWPFDDPTPYKNGVKASVTREAMVKGATSTSGTSREVWKIRDKNGGTLEFEMDYQRGVPQRVKRDIPVRSNIDLNFVKIYKDDYAVDLIMSEPNGIKRVQNYKLKTTIPELRKMFDGSEKLIGITVYPSRVREGFYP